MDTKQLEKSLEDAYKKTPPLPLSAKKMIVEWLPWLNLVIGVWTLLIAYWLWHWAHAVNNLVNYLNEVSTALGTSTVNVNRMTVAVWLSLVVLVVEAVIYLAAFSGLRERKMSGWRLLFLASFVNVAYGLVVMFTSYGGFGSLISSVVTSAIGLYFLFQIKDMYGGAKHSAAHAPETHHEDKK